MNDINIVEITPENALEHSLFCIKDVKSPAFKAKLEWLEMQHANGLKMKMAKTDKDKPMAYIEYTPGNQAWRPINAPNYMFIHCMYVYAKKDRGQGLGASLIDLCIEDAEYEGLDGVCVISSSGGWMAEKAVFEKSGFVEVEKKDRFELLVKKLNDEAPMPTFYDWEAQQQKYQGWNIIYSDQCPWNQKSVVDMMATAKEYKVDIKLTKITTAKEAQNAPSGFGTFTIIKDGKLIEDHYISATRFKNILNKMK